MKAVLLALLVAFLSSSSIYLVAGQEGGFSVALPCAGSERKLCGSDVGACMSGVRTCEIGKWSECNGGIQPTDEVCDNGLDDNCDGGVDECINYFWVAVVLIVVIIFFFLWVVVRIASG